jgi:hypothetical protein
VRVVFASARSSPGVTTAMLACASVWPGRVLLVEASEDGGALAARFALPIEPGLLTLVAASRHNTTDGAQTLEPHLQPLPGTEQIVALVGPVSAEPAQALLRTAAGRVATLLAAVADDTDVLIDAGRLTTASLARPLLAAADRLVLVTRPRVEELTALAHRLPHLATLGPQPEVLLVGQRPYGPDEVADTLGVTVVGVLAHDDDAAHALAAAGSARRLGRSRLLRTGAGIVDTLHTKATAANGTPSPAAPAGAGRPPVTGAPGANGHRPVVGRR